MKIDVVLSRRGKRYVAQAAGLPDIRVEGASRDAVLRGVEQRLRSDLDRVELVRMDMGATLGVEALPEGFGALADDPTFDDWQQEIARFRRSRDEATG